MSKYLAAYLLLNAAGSTPSADSIKTVLGSVGIEVEDEQVSTLLASLEGKTVEELIAEGNEKLASVPTGGSGAAAASGSAAAEASTEAAEEEAEEEKEESDDDMGFGLFD